VLTSDACYTREHLEKTILPGNAFDAGRMTESLALLRRMRDRQGAELLYGHDAEQWRTLPRAPRSLV
jgi:glyoxylase-like metal-dependent hydrolase (beta-lactamase superfamily II)